MMNFNDKMFMIEACKGFRNLCDDIVNIISKEQNNFMEFEDENDEKIVKLGYLGLKKDFSNKDTGVPCLLASIFFAMAVPGLKKYVIESIDGIDKQKSDYFWDSVCTLTIEDPELSTLNIEPLEIYAHYEEECKILENDLLYKAIEKLIDNIIDKYNEFMKLTDNKLDIKKVLQDEKETQERKEQEEKDSIKKHTSRMSVINVVIPGILLAPLGTMTLCHFNVMYLILAIIDIIWLFIGISCKSDTCENCGKWNSYKSVKEEVVDSYITTVQKYDSRYDRYYNATVTKERILITLQCSNCGNIVNRTIEREK